MSISDCAVGAVFATADIEAAREFYEGKLGLKPAAEPPEDPAVPINYVCGEGTTISVYLSPEHAGKSTATMAGWAVEDLEKLVDELTDERRRVRALRRGRPRHQREGDRRGGRLQGRLLPRSRREHALPEPE